jgi:hypothetical protein
MESRWINEYAPPFICCGILFFRYRSHYPGEIQFACFIDFEIKPFTNRNSSIISHYLQFQCHFSEMGLTTCIFNKNQPDQISTALFFDEKHPDVLQYCNKMASFIINVC